MIENPEYGSGLTSIPSTEKTVPSKNVPKANRHTSFVQFRRPLAIRKFATVQSTHTVTTLRTSRARCATKTPSGMGANMPFVNSARITTTPMAVNT